MTAELLQAVARFRTARVLLAGDFMRAPHTIGGAERIGSEVPILVQRIIERRAVSTGPMSSLPPETAPPPADRTAGGGHNERLRSATRAPGPTPRD